MGRFNNYLIDESTGTITVVAPDNTIVNTGRRFILDRVFDTGTHGWNDLQVAQIAIGISTDTNAGVTGPTDTAPVSTTGSWKGVSVSDWKLSNEILRKSCSVTRSGETVYARASFSNEEFSPYWDLFGTGSVRILEQGLFLSATEPTADPIDDTSQQVNAMVARATTTENNSSGYYVTTAQLSKADDGNPISIGYTWNWEGI